jgi:hypothetical protein
LQHGPSCGRASRRAVMTAPPSTAGFMSSYARLSPSDLKLREVLSRSRGLAFSPLAFHFDDSAARRVDVKFDLLAVRVARFDLIELASQRGARNVAEALLL